MNIKPAGISNLEALVHLINAALEHCPPATKAIFDGLAQPHVTALNDILDPPGEKNQDHG